MVMVVRKRRKNQKPSKRWRLSLVIVGTVVLLAAGALGWYLTMGNPNENTQNVPVYPGPTEEEQKAGDDQKAKLDEERPVQHETNEDGKQVVNVVISDASQYGDTIEVRAYIPDSFEAGVCTVTFSRNGEKIVKTVEAFTDSSYTICPMVAVPVSEFPAAGTWTVEVVYSSESYFGKVSQNLEVL